jgi:hypothetical protein
MRSQDAGQLEKAMIDIVIYAIIKKSKTSITQYTDL